MSSINSFPFTDPIVVLVGPTAIGKTSLSIALAKQFDFEIVSVDSMQVYRYMDIGTAKVTEEEMEGVRHHLIDVVDPDEPFDSGIYEKTALKAIQNIQGRGKRVLVTGGTGLYLNALVNGLSPQLPAFPDIREELERELERTDVNVLHDVLASIDGSSAKRIHKNDTRRVIRAIEIFKGTGRKWSDIIAEHKALREIRFPNILQIGLTRDREKLYERINLRSKIMIESGLEQEVLNLNSKGYGSSLKSMQAIGYSHMASYISGRYGFEEMSNQLARDTRRYAKRQYTWFRKVEGLHWLEIEQSDKASGMVSRFFNDYDASKLG